MKPVVSLICLALLSAGAGAQSRSQKLSEEELKKLPAVVQLALRNFSKLRYSGTRIVEFRQGPERKRHTEWVLRDGSRARTEFPEGSAFAGQIIVENRGERRHFFPDRNEIHVMPARRDEAFFRLFAMLGGRGSSTPKITAGDPDSIAGHRAIQVDVSDTAGNVIQKLWIHATNGLVMKREIFDRVGTRIGLFEFTSIDFSPRISRDEFEIKRRGAQIVTPRDRLRAEAQKAGLQPLALSRGSGWSLEHVRVIRPAGEPILVQTYIGKHTPVTLFQLKSEVDQQRLDRLGRGLSIHHWRQDGVTLVLVGDLPAESLRQLAAGVSRSE